MPMNQPSPLRLLGILLFLTCISFSSALGQQITGVWRGKIDRRKVEVKLIQKGDSLTGTSYYYDAPGSFRRYSIRGYFDPQDNSVVWWDEQLLEDHSGMGLFGKGKTPLMSVADFNCPGGAKMFLEGSSFTKEDMEHLPGPVDLVKIDDPSFRDEWDYVIENYTAGTNDPELIDSVGLIASAPRRRVPERATVPEATPGPLARRTVMVSIPAPPPPKEEEPEPVVARPLTIEEKFTSRNKVFTLEIPVAGDSIELRFYDNAEIDGDSISLFLNNRLLFEHIRLTNRAYTIKLAVAELAESSELIMVAENLGSIPPNTSYMVALVGGERYEAKLASTENSSAMIRLRRTGP